MLPLWIIGASNTAWSLELAERVNWAYHLEEYAKSLEVDPISVEEYCKINGLAFGSAKRHLSAKKARLFLNGDAEKGKTPKKSKSKVPKSGSLKIPKKPAKSPVKKPAKRGTGVGHTNSRSTGASVPIEKIPAAIVKKAVINMEQDDTNHTRPLERVLTVLHAQFEYALQNQMNMHGAMEHIYDTEGMPTKEEWNEGEAYILKKYRCDAASGSSLAGLADTISQVQKRQAEILVKRRELSAFTRIEELEIIQAAYESRITGNLSATDTVRLIESRGVTPPLSLSKEMEKEITFLEPPEEIPAEGMSDAEFDLEVIEYENSLGAELAKLTALGNAFNGGINVGHDNSDGLLEESDFE